MQPNKITMGEYYCNLPKKLDETIREERPEKVYWSWDDYTE